MFKTNIHTVNGIQIETFNECPPVPIRIWDWVAWRVCDAGEEDAINGQGATEQEAIADLFEQLSYEED